MKKIGYKSVSKPGAIDYVRLVLIREEDKKILVTTQPSGHFVFPGGKVKRGESVLQALPRELFEELNFGPDHIAATMLGVIGSYSEYFEGYGREFIMVSAWGLGYGPVLPGISLVEDNAVVGWYDSSQLKSENNYPNFNKTLELIGELLRSGAQPLFSQIL